MKPKTTYRKASEKRKRKEEGKNHRWRTHMDQKQQRNEMCIIKQKIRHIARLKHITIFGRKPYDEIQIKLKIA